MSTATRGTMSVDWEQRVDFERLREERLAKLRAELRVEIKRLHHNLGNTMVYVTHDQIEAMTLADRIVLMRGGVIEQQGAPLTLFERPATKYVAGFLGSPAMNFVKGTITGNGVKTDSGLVLPIASAPAASAASRRS